MANELKPDVLLSARERVGVGLAAGVFLVLAVMLYFRPPVRQVIELNSKKTDTSITDKIASSPADPTTLVIMLATASALMTVYALNGLRVIKLSMANVSAESVLNPAAAGAAKPQETAASTQRDATAVMNNFLLVSSWNGLKVLKACQLAFRKGRPFTLKAPAILGGTSYDYAFGFLIASIAAGAVAGPTDPTTGLMSVQQIDPVVDGKLDEIIAGNIAVDRSLAEFKRAELAAIERFFAAQN